MATSIEAIRKTFRVKEGNAGYDSDQYIFPNSSYIYLKEEDLWNLTQESLRIAKNEILPGMDISSERRSLPNISANATGMRERFRPVSLIPVF